MKVYIVIYFGEDLVCVFADEAKAQAWIDATGHPDAYEICECEVQ